jgi:thiol-disulfide isomerase/thioredoxin
MTRTFVALIGALLWFAAVSAGAAEPPMVLNETPKPLPEINFTDGTGHARTLADFKGKVVLLNVWATWCGPCRKEMPTLDRLQAALGGPDFEVVPLSIDRRGLEVVNKFYAEIGIEHLARYLAPSASEAFDKLSVFGLPATFLIDRQGRELGRRDGPAEWDSPEMITFFKSTIAKQKETSP